MTENLKGFDCLIPKNTKPDNDDSDDSVVLKTCPYCGYEFSTVYVPISCPNCDAKWRKE